MTLETPILDELIEARERVADDMTKHVAEATTRVRWQAVEARWHPGGPEVIVDGVSTMISRKRRPVAWMSALGQRQNDAPTPV